eukprot:9194251-Lingulodinium_polyedra.AAC.1
MLGSRAIASQHARRIAGWRCETRWRPPTPRRQSTPQAPPAPTAATAAPRRHGPSANGNRQTSLATT